jgi:DNA invertase Pin-like site-specific DNA recombinase
VRRDDAWTRARRATEEMERHLVAIARLADERALAIQELLDDGLTRSEVARRLGVTPAVITKILKRPVVTDGSHDREHPAGSHVRHAATRAVRPRNAAPR